MSPALLANQQEVEQSRFLKVQEGEQGCVTIAGKMNFLKQ